MPKPPSTVEIALDTLRSSGGPMSFKEMLETIQANCPITTKNPSKTLRSALSNTTLIVSTGDGRYEYLPRAATGALLRQPLDMDQAKEGVIVWEQDVSVAIWPAAHETSGDRTDTGPREFRFGDDQQIELTYQWLAASRFGSIRANPIWEWLKTQGAKSGDSLLVKIVDGEARSAALAFERSEDRDEKAIRARNAELADAMESILKRLAHKTKFSTEVAAALIVRGLYQNPCPPDPMTAIAVEDDRFAMDSISIALRGYRPPSIYERTWVLERPRIEAKREIEQVYQLKVTLEQVRPPVWRRIQVPSDITLADLHETIQAAMGWSNYHLYSFTAGDLYFTCFDESYEGWGIDALDAAQAKVCDVLRRVTDRLSYEYDFGDGWGHQILLEKILSPEPDVHYPVCLKGKRACPPEDCGGPWGYAEFLAAIQDPEHEEHESFLEWVGGEFDPEAFDIDKVNALLSCVKFH